MERQKGNYTEFNKAFKGFIKDLSRSYPDVPEFKMMLGGYKVVKTLNKKYVSQLFKSTINPYVKNIMERDASFFINPGFTLSDEYSIVYKAMVPVFVNLWTKSDEVNREAVWNHLQYLILLSNKCE